MNDTIRPQVNKLWELLSSPKTIQTYREAIAVTWNILRETAVLAWLLLCLVLVFFDWIWNAAIAATQSTRSWFDQLEERSSQRVASEAGKTILTVGQRGLASTIAQARSQLGLPARTTPELTIPVSPTKQPIELQVPEPVTPASASMEPSSASEPSEEGATTENES
jgi:hypothetical protein